MSPLCLSKVGPSGAMGTTQRAPAAGGTDDDVRRVAAAIEKENSATPRYAVDSTQPRASGPVSGLLMAWLCGVPRVPRPVVVGSCASPVPSLPVAFATLRPLSRTALRDSDLFGKLAPNTPPAHEQGKAKHDTGHGREDEGRTKHAARTTPLKASHDKAQAAAAARWSTPRVEQPL